MAKLKKPTRVKTCQYRLTYRVNGEYVQGRARRITGISNEIFSKEKKFKSKEFTHLNILGPDREQANEMKRYFLTKWGLKE